MKWKQDFLAGIIFLVGMVIIGFFTIMVKDISILSGQKGRISVLFDRVDGLEVGHKVLASGMYVGNVAELNLQPDGRVKVDIVLTKPLTLYKGYSIKVKDDSPLGGKHVYIEVGKRKEALFRINKGFEEALQQKMLSPDLRKEFKVHNAALSENVVITASDQGWKIEDPATSQKYTIKPDGIQLAVYSPAGESEVKPIASFP